MHPTSSLLNPDARAKIAATLDASLTDGVDLQTQLKVAHWNVKGPHFATLHPLLETFAVAAAATNDEIAERAVTLGGLATATARRAAKSSRIGEFPVDTTDGLTLVAAVLERFDAYLTGLRTAREVAAELGDGDTEDLLTQRVTEFEKYAWFLHATLGR